MTCHYYSIQNRSYQVEKFKKQMYLQVPILKILHFNASSMRSFSESETVAERVDAAHSHQNRAD